ncbi:MAG: hypothetical protein H6700_06040 [Myxococcales bacterium]|nr:hypothetical protein [Myxococcales bacterium]
MSVQIVDPSEVSQIIHLEPSRQSVPRAEDAGSGGIRGAQQRTGAPNAVRVPTSSPVAVDGGRRAATGAPPQVEARSSGSHSAAPQASGSQPAVPAVSGAYASAAPGAVAAPQVSGSHAAAATGKLRPVVSGSVYNERLVARKLAVSLHASIRESGCETILLTSPSARAGKTFFASLMRPELDEIAPGKYLFVDHRQLSDYDPSRRPDGLTVIVDGPAMMEGDGLLVVPQRWMQAFDGALLLVLGRDTPSEDLEDSVRWLDESRIRVIGVVFNELLAPDPTVRLSIWREMLRSGQWRAELRDAIRTRGRSLRRRR